MRYGNCLLGMLWILWTIDQPGRLVIKRSDFGCVPHLLFRTKQGVYHHYKLVKDVLPWPLCYLCFEGKFQTHRSKL